MRGMLLERRARCAAPPLRGSQVQACRLGARGRDRTEKYPHKKKKADAMHADCRLVEVRRLVPVACPSGPLALTSCTGSTCRPTA